MTIKTKYADVLVLHGVGLWVYTGGLNERLTAFLWTVFTSRGYQVMCTVQLRLMVIYLVLQVFGHK